MSPDLITALPAQKESRTFEVKRVRGGELTRCLQSLTAFANTAGGLLVLGLEDPDKAEGADRLYGVQENESAVDDLRRQIHTRVQPIIGGELAPEPVFRNIPCRLRDGSPGHLVAIEIRPSRDLHSIVDGGTWERLEKGNRQLSAGEITERRFQLGAASILDQPVDVSLELLDTVSWQDYRNQRGISRSLPEALRHLGLAKEISSTWKPTRLAVLLFADYPAELLGEKCTLRLFHYRGDKIEHSGSTTNLVRAPRTIGGSALNQIRGGLRAVEEELASGLQVSSMGFETIQRYPRRAIQEAITNAVIHRDYAIPGDIHIRIFSDRIEVESPGGLPHRLQIPDLGRVRSHPRNLSLVNHLREFPTPPNQDAGEGILMMRSLMRQADLYPPIYQQIQAAVRESLVVALYNQSRPTTWDQVSDYLDKHPDVSNAEVRKILQTQDTLGISKLLKSWVDVRLMEVVNPEAAKQLRRYRKPGPGAKGFFSWFDGNEAEQSAQPPDSSAH